MYFVTWRYGATKERSGEPLPLRKAGEVADQLARRGLIVGLVPA